MQFKIFRNEKGELEQITLEEALYSCPTKKFYRFIKHLEKQIEAEKLEEYTKQAIKELREQVNKEIKEEEENEVDEEETKDIENLLNIMDEFVNRVVERYLEIKDRRNRNGY